jgi:hypothetical protein
MWAAAESGFRRVASLSSAMACSSRMGAERDPEVHVGRIALGPDGDRDRIIARRLGRPGLGAPDAGPPEIGPAELVVDPEVVGLEPPGTEQYPLAPRPIVLGIEPAGQEQEAGRRLPPERLLVVGQPGKHGLVGPPDLGAQGDAPGVRIGDACRLVQPPPEPALLLRPHRVADVRPIVEERRQYDRRGPGVQPAPGLLRVELGDVDAEVAEGGRIVGVGPIGAEMGAPLAADGLQASRSAPQLGQRLATVIGGSPRRGAEIGRLPNRGGRRRPSR